MLRRFEVHRATSLEEAIDLRRRYGDEAAIYAGGTELLAAMKLGVARWPHLIDVKPIAGLRAIGAAPNAIRIGACVTHWELERDPAIARTFPAFAQLERNVANVRVRAAGTLGGNIAFAEPHADPPALLIALGARAIVHGPDGERAMALQEFITGMYQTALGADELLVAIEIPLPAQAARAAYVKFQILERPSVGVAIAATMRDSRFTGTPRVVVGAVDEAPRTVATDAFAGADPTDARIAEALADAARRSVDPAPDLAGTAEYKRHLVGVFAKRALASLAAAA